MLDRQIEQGGAKNCPACFGHAKVHSAECRARFEQLLGRGGAAAAGSPADAAGRSAQEPQPETDAAMQVDSAVGSSAHAAATGSSVDAAGSHAQDDAVSPADDEDMMPNEGSPAKAARLIGGLPTLRGLAWLAGPEGSATSSPSEAHRRSCTLLREAPRQRH